MVDEIITMATVDNEWYKSNHDTSFLTPEQQAYFLAFLFILFIIGVVCLWWISRKGAYETK